MKPYDIVVWRGRASGNIKIHRSWGIGVVREVVKDFMTSRETHVLINTGTRSWWWFPIKQLTKIGRL